MKTKCVSTRQVKVDDKQIFVTGFALGFLTALLTIACFVLPFCLRI
jgi:hypothetical protein